MAWPLVAAKVAAYVVAAAASVYGATSASKSAGRAGKKGARLEGQVTTAKLFDLFKQERLLKGQTISRIAGSGVKYSPETSTSSPMEILMEQAKNFERERTTVATVGATAAQQGLQRASMAQTQAISQGVVGASTSLASAFSMLGK